MSPRWEVPPDEVSFRYMASGGPGGQHANRSNTKVEAVFHLDESASMPEARCKADADCAAWSSRP